MYDGFILAARRQIAIGRETDQFWVLDTRGTRLFMAVTDIAVEPTKVVRDNLSFGA